MAMLTSTGKVSLCVEGFAADQLAVPGEVDVCKSWLQGE